MYNIDEIDTRLPIHINLKCIKVQNIFTCLVVESVQRYLSLPIEVQIKRIHELRHIVPAQTNLRLLNLLLIIFDL